MGLRTHAAFDTAGTGGRTGATNAQCFFTSDVDAAGPTPSGHTAPAAIHRLMRAICAGAKGRGAHRHTHLPAESEEAAVEQAFVRLAGNDDRARLTALYRRVPGIETEIAHLQPGSVTSGARLVEHRVDIARKVGRGLRMQPRSRNKSEDRHKE